MKWLEKQAMNDVYVQKKTLTLSIQLIQNYMDLHILHIIISLKITCKKKWKAKMAWKPGDEWCMRPEEDADIIHSINSKLHGFTYFAHHNLIKNNL